MMKIYQVDAFVSDRYRGNTAGVCLLNEPLQDTQMQAIAREMGYAETAFLVPEGDRRWDIRWFTPEVEVDLCGHATLTSAWVLSQISGESGTLTFSSRSGDLVVEVEEPFLTLNFPAGTVELLEPDVDLFSALGVEGTVYRSDINGGYYLVELDNAGEVQGLMPDMELLRTLPEGGVIVTAAGEDCDFVSRFFAPKMGIDEDDVTGSAHCVLTPFWAQKLGKTELLAHQLSERGGELVCTAKDDRVLLKGQAKLRTVRQLSGSFFTNEFIDGE